MAATAKLYRLTSRHFQVSMEGCGYGNIYKADSGLWYGDARWIGGRLRKQIGHYPTRKQVQGKIETILKG